MKYFLALLFSGLTSWAYNLPADEVLVDGRIAHIGSSPLATYPWPGERPRLSEYPDEGMSDARELAAVWEIREGRLFLLAVSGFRFDGFAPRQAIGLRELMPERIKEGRVFADWFTGELQVFERERIDPRLSLRPVREPFRVVTRVFQVRSGVVEEAPDQASMPAAAPRWP